jgi:hypothetical protein
MATLFWPKTDRFMRALHLYTGLFLTPWMLVYATSALCLNHDAWIRDLLHVVPPSWEVVREVPFTPRESLSDSPDDQANAVLQELDLDGPHHIFGKPTPQQLVVLRASGGGNYRITWRRAEAKLVVEQLRPFSFVRLLHYLHFRGGYGQPYPALICWAVLVDAVAVSLWLWVISGIYLWARRPSKRKLGGACLALGGILFAVLVAWLCR